MKMRLRVIQLARQLMSSVPQTEMSDLIKVLTYYNSKFSEANRVPAMERGSRDPDDPLLEKEIREWLEKSAGSQAAYVMTTQTVCQCCGK